MDVTVLSALQKTLCGGFVPAPLVEDECCCAVCAAAHYVCWQELRIFASGLEMDIAALFALQFATFVGRSFVPLPLVLRWMLLRCLRCSSLRLLAGALYLCIWFEDGCYCAVRAAARYVCWQELRTFASGWKMDVCALSALQLATFVGSSLVSWPLVLVWVDIAALPALRLLRLLAGALYLCLCLVIIWRWIWLRCLHHAARYVCRQELRTVALVWRWTLLLRCLRCNSLRCW